MTAKEAEYEQIELAIGVEEIDRNIYRSIQLWKPGGGRGVFGGQIIAQACWAATTALRKDEPGTKKSVHSLHCYFLSFGNADIPVLYQITAIRDGRSYSTRSVLATQQGNPIFTLTCSFCLPEPKQPVQQYPVPSWPLTLESIAGKGGPVPQPEDCLPTEERLEKVLNAKNLDIHPKLREYVERNAAERRQSSIEMRNSDHKDLGGLISTSHGKKPQQMIWFRSRAAVRSDPDFQKCVLAYASDFSFIGTAARAAGLNVKSQPGLGMMASLDHAMYFYDDSVDASEWMLFYMESPMVSNGRGLASGRIYKRDGSLAVVCTQEGVVRAAL